MRAADCNLPSEWDTIAWMEGEKKIGRDAMSFEKRPGTDIVLKEVFGMPANVLIDLASGKCLEAFVHYKNSVDRKFVFDPESGRLMSVSTRMPDGTVVWEDSAALLKTYGAFADKVSMGTDILFTGEQKKIPDKPLTEYGGGPLPPYEAFDAESLRNRIDPSIPPQ